MLCGAVKEGSTDASAKLPRGIALNATFPFWMNMCNLKVANIQRAKSRMMCGCLRGVIPKDK